MDPLENFLNVHFDEFLIFLEQQIQPQNMQYQVNNEINLPQVEYQTIQQVYQPNGDLNLQPSTPTPKKEKEKRTRTKYTDDQINCLEEHFKINTYITPKVRKELAASLRMKEQQIKKWFQNKRMYKSAFAKKKCKLPE